MTATVLSLKFLQMLELLVKIYVNYFSPKIFGTLSCDLGLSHRKAPIDLPFILKILLLCDLMTLLTTYHLALTT